MLQTAPSQQKQTSQSLSHHHALLLGLQWQLTSERPNPVGLFEMDLFTAMLVRRTSAHRSYSVHRSFVNVVYTDSLSLEASLSRSLVGFSSVVCVACRRYLCDSVHTESKISPLKSLFFLLCNSCFYELGSASPFPI